MEKGYDPEEWEREYWIYSEERWDDLVRLREEEVEGNDNDEDSLVKLADALVLAKRHEKAMNILSRLHINNPKESDINNRILEILKDTGKKENDFNWKESPEILRLDESLFQFCLDILKKKRKKKKFSNYLKKSILHLFIDKIKFRFHKYFFYISRQKCNL